MRPPASSRRPFAAMAADTPAPPLPWRDFLHPRWWPTWLGVGVIRVVALLPVPVLFRLGAGIGHLAWHVARRRRHIALVNLRLCFPELDDDAIERLARANLVATGIATLETALAWFRPTAQLRDRVSITGLEHLEAARADGGVLLVGAHFVTLDVAGGLLSLFTPVDAMYRADDNALFDLLQRRARLRHCDVVIERNDVRGAIRRLRAGHVLWYAPDQDYGRRHSVFAPFFGIPAASITATTRLAELGRARVVYFSHFRDAANGAWRLHLHPGPAAWPTGDAVADATTINAHIEAEVRRDPAQYLWVHRRFKTRPEGEARPY